MAIEGGNAPDVFTAVTGAPTEHVYTKDLSTA